MAKTTTDLLNNIKRRCQLPDDGGTLSDADILALASDELQNVVAPKLVSQGEWHYAFSYNETVTSSRTYRMNSRTAGNRIISVEYYDGTSYRFINLRHPLTQNKPGMSAEDYSIYGNNITLSDGCPTSGTLRIRALLRPSSLVASGCTNTNGAIAGTDTLVVGSTSSFSALAGSNGIDIYYASSPYEVRLITTIASVVNATDMILSYDIDTAFAIELATAGLFRAAPAETTDRVPLPDELHDYLAQRTAIRCMEARGLTNDMQNHIRKLGDLESSFDRLTSPRSKGEFKAIISEDYFFSGRP